MKCPKCQTRNPEIRKFCRKCGSKFALICAECQFENLPGGDFAEDVVSR